MYIHGIKSRTHSRAAIIGLCVFTFPHHATVAADISDKKPPAKSIKAPISRAPERITVVGGPRDPATRQPAGQTTYSATRSSYANTPALSVADMLVGVPGVSVTAGNGPRDVIVSVRGSGNRQSYGLKNLQVLEDGFVMTQPDGTARSDLIDPHAYDRVDVFEGPASTLYGNYAINGAISFQTRNGADIHGIELGSDFGSWGTINNYATFGTAGKTYDLMVFASDVRGNGFIGNSNYATSTENMRLRVNLTSSDRLILKFINNVTDTALPIRLSLDQYRTNPYQKGCSSAANASAGCATVSLYTNGLYGQTASATAAQAGLGRFDRRTLVGLRWEHDFNSRTTWRNQFGYDQRHIDQPTSSVSYVGPYNSYAFNSDISNWSRIWGKRLTSFAGINYDYLDYGSLVYNVTPQGGATRGGFNQTSFGHQWNLGARFQEELQIDRRVKIVVGLGGTYSDLGATETLFGYSASGQTRSWITANRFFFNLAPEASLVYAPTDSLTLHTRVGTAYETPTTSNLFVTPQGTYGNNTSLKSETSVGVDLGADWRPLKTLQIQTTGFYEFYKNEMVSQSAGANAVGSYYFNAPASVHRGVEIGSQWTPLPKILPGGSIKLSYTYDNQIYTKYTEVLSNSTSSRSFNRSGNAIPGVIPHFLNARFLYDQPSGFLKGLGGFVEVTWRGSYWLDNANILKAPGYKIVNFELHYDPPKSFGWVHRVHTWIEVQNAFNKQYIAGATNLSDTLLANNTQAGASALAAKTGSIYAGSPRAVYGGVRFRL